MLTFKVRRSGAALPELAQKHFAPSMVHVINQTIEAIQTQQRSRIPTQLTLRTAASRRLINNLVYIGKRDFASVKQQRFTGRVRLTGEDASEGIRRFAPRILRFQFGGVEHADSGPLYVPTKALRPSPGAVIKRDLFPRALGLLESRQIQGGSAFRARGKSRKTGVHTTGMGRIQLKGKLRTFAIDPRFSPSASGFGVWQRRSGAVYQNLGRAIGVRSETSKLWNYVRQIRYPKRLTFQEDSERFTQGLPARLKADLAKRSLTALVRRAR